MRAKSVRFALGFAFALCGVGAGEAATLIQAGQCSQLAGQLVDIGQQAATLTYNNPGSATVFGSCLAVGANSYQSSHSESDAMAAFTLCAGIACAATDSYQNCVSVGVQLFLLTLRATDLENRRNALGCGN